MKRIYNTQNIWDFKEYDKDLLCLNKFYYLKYLEVPVIKELILNLSFKPIAFQKIRSLFFFFFLELISNNKPNLNKSMKNHIFWKVKKGNLVSCHVNLKKLNLINFLSYFLFTINQWDSYYNFDLNHKFNNNLSFNLNNLFSFYQTKQDYDSKLENIQLSVKLNTLSHEEKLFILSLYKFKIF